MEAYSSSSSSSSFMQDRNSNKVPYYSSTLHSVRKPGLAKPWKKPVAPLPRTPPRVYKVDPINFRDLVQKLTAAPEFQLESKPPQAPQPRLHTMAPPPVLAAAHNSAILFRPSPEKASLSTVYKEFSEVLETRPQNTNKVGPVSDINNVIGSNFLGLNSSSMTSPSPSHNWCAYPLLSPGTLSSLEQSRVL